MSKKRKALGIGYITLRDGTEVEEYIYTPIKIILENFASGYEGLEGFAALEDIAKKVSNPKHQICSNSMGLLREFFEKNGEINASIAAIIRNLIVSAPKRPYFVEEIGEKEFDEEVSRIKPSEKKSKEKDVEVDETELLDKEDEAQGNEEEEDVDDVLALEYENEEAAGSDNPMLVASTELAEVTLVPGSTEEDLEEEEPISDEEEEADKVLIFEWENEEELTTQEEPKGLIGDVETAYAQPLEEV